MGHKFVASSRFVWFSYN